MNITILSGKGFSAQTSFELKRLGHKSSCFIVKSAYRSIWRGIDYGQLDKFPDCNKSDLILFDSSGGGRTADRLKSQGLAVLGSSVFADSLVEDADLRDLVSEGRWSAEEQQAFADLEEVELLWLGLTRSLFCKGLVYTHHLTGSLGRRCFWQNCILWQETTDRLLAMEQILKERNCTGLFCWNQSRSTLSCDWEPWFWLLQRLVGLEVLLLDRTIPNNLKEPSQVVVALKVESEKLGECFLDLPNLDSFFLRDVVYDGGLKLGSHGEYTLLVAGVGDSQQLAYESCLANCEQVQMEDKYYKLLPELIQDSLVFENQPDQSEVELKQLVD